MRNTAPFMLLGGLLCLLSIVTANWLPPVVSVLFLGTGVSFGVIGARRTWALFSYWRRCSRICAMFKRDFQRALAEDRIADAEALHRRLGRVLEVWGASIDANQVGRKDPEDL